MGAIAHVSASGWARIRWVIKTQVARSIIGETRYNRERGSHLPVSTTIYQRQGTIDCALKRGRAEMTTKPSLHANAINIAQ